MNKEEIKIITLGDIFKNIETEEKAFKFKDYIKDLQKKAELAEHYKHLYSELKKQKDDVVKFVIKLYQKEYNKTSDWWLQEELCNNFDDMNIFTNFELERMLGEIE